MQPVHRGIISTRYIIEDPFQYLEHHKWTGADSYTSGQIARKADLFRDVGYGREKQEVLREYRSQQLHTNTQTEDNGCWEPNPLQIK